MASHLLRSGGGHDRARGAHWAGLGVGLHHPRCLLRQDEQAGWSFSKRFGYKVHTLLCRDSLLPILFLLSPANRNDAPWAVPLMALAHWLFRLPVAVVRADAAYFTRPILAFIVGVLRATPKVVFNPRRVGNPGLDRAVSA